ncbi:hypothetical protein [Paractinoplanes deccanensis]|nr:hypothetical protein [Actinoplanes deccanensis]
MSFRQKSRRATRPVRHEGARTARLMIGLFLVLGTLFLAAYTAATS